jgi:hypothetical protein
LRRWLLGIFGFGAAGTGVELLLLGHFESGWERLPLVLLGIGVLVTLWQIAAPSRVSVRTLQVTMLLFLVTGAVGIGQHFDSNVEFELEMYPSMTGVELIGKTLTGALPVLAPGTMTLLGLVGLAHTYRHPQLTGDG